MKKQIKIAIGIVAIIGIAALAFSLKGKKEEKMVPKMLPIVPNEEIRP